MNSFSRARHLYDSEYGTTNYNHVSPSGLLDSSQEDGSLADGQAAEEKGEGEFKEPILSLGILRLCLLLT